MNNHWINKCIIFVGKEDGHEEYVKVLSSMQLIHWYQVIKNSCCPRNLLESTLNHEKYEVKIVQIYNMGGLDFRHPNWFWKRDLKLIIISQLYIVLGSNHIVFI